MKTDQTNIEIIENERNTWVWIKNRLALLDSSFAKIAQIHGVRRQNISIAKHRPYPKYERLLAESIDLLPSDLWPHRYNSNHKPNRPKTGRPKKKKETAP